DVDDLGLGADAADHAVHDPGVLVAGAEIRDERHERRHRRHCTPATVSTAATSPSTLCGSASATGSMPRSRSDPDVTGPIETARSRPPAPSGNPSTTLATVEDEATVTRSAASTAST